MKNDLPLPWGRGIKGDGVEIRMSSTEQKDELLAEREQLKQEYNKWLKLQLDAFRKQEEMIPEDKPEGMMISLDSSPEFTAEFDRVCREGREAAARVRETLEKIGEINAQLEAK
jgi:hypothetical protein